MRTLCMCKAFSWQEEINKLPLLISSSDKDIIEFGGEVDWLSDESTSSVSPPSLFWSCTHSSGLLVVTTWPDCFFTATCQTDQAIYWRVYTDRDIAHRHVQREKTTWSYLCVIMSLSDMSSPFIQDIQDVLAKRLLVKSHCQIGAIILQFFN